MKQTTSKEQWDYSEEIKMIKYHEQNSQFFTQLFPKFTEEIHKEEEFQGRFLQHCIFGDVLNQKVVELLKRKDCLENKLLQRIFRMYENFAVHGDEEIQNLLQVTLLEYLWDEKVTYDRVLELMGDGTREIWEYIYRYIRIPQK